MKVKLLRERALVDLRSKVKANLDLYRTGNFEYLNLDPALSFNSEVDLLEDEISKLRSPVGPQSFEAENCVTMLAGLPDLTPYQAADERLWTMLSHTVLLSHARARWPIPSKPDEAEEHIRKHFFAQNYRQLERDNVGARLWWMGHLCARVKGMTLKQALDVFLFRSDVRANIVERPTTAQSVAVFSALLRKLGQSYNGKKKLFERNTFRSLMIQLNGLGGYKLLDALDAKSVENLIDDLLATRLRVTEI
jgi:Family of unknown function (DUF6339)